MSSGITGSSLAAVLLDMPGVAADIMGLIEESGSRVLEGITC